MQTLHWWASNMCFQYFITGSLQMRWNHSILISQWRTLLIQVWYGLYELQARYLGSFQVLFTPLSSYLHSSVKLSSMLCQVIFTSLSSQLHSSVKLSSLLCYLHFSIKLSSLLCQVLFTSFLGQSAFISVKFFSFLYQVSQFVKIKQTLF